MVEKSMQLVVCVCVLLCHIKTHLCVHLHHYSLASEFLQYVYTCMSMSVSMFTCIAVWPHADDHMLIVRGKQDQERDWNKDEGNVRKKMRGRGVYITCPFSFCHALKFYFQVTRTQTHKHSISRKREGEIQRGR